jgi:hypothetical protein
MLAIENACCPRKIDSTVVRAYCLRFLVKGAKETKHARDISEELILYFII